MCEVFEAIEHLLLGAAACIAAVGSIYAARASRDSRSILRNGKE